VPFFSNKGDGLLTLSRKGIFLLGLILAGSGAISAPIALFAGLVYGMTLSNPFPDQSKYVAKFLLQASVVALGFGMNLHAVLQAGRSGFVYTAGSISVAMLLGLALGHMIQVSRKSAFLISTGTAICGGSAIAAVGPIADANEEEMAVALGTVFVLNSIALFVFPQLGYLFGMSQEQFGLWAALAIHDTSSVVGAAAKYGVQALQIATTIKLARALWIVPLCFLTAVVMKSKARIQWPWFILFFCLAALLNTEIPSLSGAFGALNQVGKLGLTMTLFLIGTGLNRQTLKKVGFRPLLQGLVLWIMVGCGTFLLIRSNWIHL